MGRFRHQLWCRGAVTLTTGILLLLPVAILPSQVQPWSLVLPTTQVPSDGAYFFGQLLLWPALSALLGLAFFGGMVLVVRALTQLHQSSRTAAQANRAKARFLRGLSERIRAPMTGLVGMTDLLLNSNLNQDQREFACVVHDSAHSLLYMLNSLLEYARLDDGTIQTQYSDFDLHGLMEDTAMRYAQLAHEKNLLLSCCISPAVPHIVRGDPVLLGRLLSVLLANAVRFTESGEVTLSARLTRKNRRHVCICFDVVDTGVGIAPNRHMQLLRRDLTIPTGAEESGSGLGLAIAQLIAARFHGNVDLHSQQGKGSVFWSVLRFDKPSIPEPPVERPPLPPDLLICVVAQHAALRRMLIWKLAALGIRCLSIEEPSKIPPGTRIVFMEGAPPPPLPLGVIFVALIRSADEAASGIPYLKTPLRLATVAALFNELASTLETTQLAALADRVASHQHGDVHKLLQPPTC